MFRPVAVPRYVVALTIIILYGCLFVYMVVVGQLAMESFRETRLMVDEFRRAVQIRDAKFVEIENRLKALEETQIKLEQRK